MNFDTSCYFSYIYVTDSLILSPESYLNIDMFGTEPNIKYGIWRNVTVEFEGYIFDDTPSGLPSEDDLTIFEVNITAFLIFEKENMFDLSGTLCVG